MNLKRAGCSLCQNVQGSAVNRGLSCEEISILQSLNRELLGLHLYWTHYVVILLDPRLSRVCIPRLCGCLGIRRELAENSEFLSSSCNSSIPFSGVRFSYLWFLVLVTYATRFFVFLTKCYSHLDFCLIVLNDLLLRFC